MSGYPLKLNRLHRAGFRRYWRWKSRPLGGRPQIDADLQLLIRRMSVDNPLWGAPRIHGELLKLGFEVAQASVAKYMVKRCGPPSQGWNTFLRNHAPSIAAMDLFVVPTIGFDLLYVLVIVRLARRDLVWINVTPNPTAEWIAHQITEAFPWNGRSGKSLAVADLHRLQRLRHHRGTAHTYCPVSSCAVERRDHPMGNRPTRQLSLQPVAIGAVVEVTKRLKPLV
jgi:hypothetical protein